MDKEKEKTVKKSISGFDKVLYAVYLLFVILILIFVVCSVNDDAEKWNEDLQTSVIEQIEKLPPAISITSESELAAIKSDGHYYLTNNIILSSSWKPALSEEIFCGSIDGNGYSINCSLATDNRGYFPGLLSSAGNGCIIYNLTLTDCSVKQGAFIKTLAENSSVTLYRCLLKGEDIPLVAEDRYTYRHSHISKQNADELMIGYNPLRKARHGEQNSVSYYIEGYDDSINSSAAVLWCNVEVVKEGDNNGFE